MLIARLDNCVPKQQCNWDILGSLSQTRAILRSTTRLGGHCLALGFRNTCLPNTRWPSINKSNRSWRYDWPFHYQKRLLHYITLILENGDKTPNTEKHWWIDHHEFRICAKNTFSPVQWDFLDPLQLAVTAANWLASDYHANVLLQRLGTFCFLSAITILSVTTETKPIFEQAIPNTI